MTATEVVVPWVIDREKTHDHWLEVNDGEGWYSAVVKWDGCIHLNRYYNFPWGKDPIHPEADNEDYIHICDLDEFIARLQALKVMAETHFGEWPQ